MNSTDCSPLRLSNPPPPLLASPISLTSDQLIALPITPPATEVDPQHGGILYTAVQVLSTEATALSHLSRLYATHPGARDGFVKAVEGIARSLKRGGKVVIVGVGKSGKIGQKLVATMNSLGLLSVFLHPVEALHGDLGMLRPNDILILISFSGNTPELLALLPHIPSHIPAIILTSHLSYHTSKLTSYSNSILLPAPIPESEESTFGLSAPTTSTTVSMALGDAIALAVARTVHVQEGSGPRDVFKRNHPGGAIGLNIGRVSIQMSDFVVPLSDIPLICEDFSVAHTPISSASSTSSEDSENESCWSTECRVRVLDCLLAAVRAPKGWLRISKTEVIPPRRLQRVRNPQLSARDPQLDLIVSKERWIKVAGEASIDEIRKMVLTSRADPVDGSCVLVGTVIGVVVQDSIIGVVEVEDVLEAR